ncbi:YkvA family protein [Halioxenophilus sp. WMMB6]|uniref:YkvA family protein n=1 Tax=Halioxenophilus sp. WMMB6 TaxID=3073815 RepID=UPI00295E71EB|nr:DUF1232 domain-containing protein [Halioxenophilus sp. WMMB6]
MIATLKRWARQLKAYTYALYLVSKHPEVPWPTKLFIALIVAYALSPIDLIPDFIPVLGYLDDLLLLPLAIWLAIKLIPHEVWQECVVEAEATLAALPTSRVAGLVVVAIWLLILLAIGFWLWGKMV